MSQPETTQSFEEFYLREFPRLVAVIDAWSGSCSVAQDLAQDALLQARQRWDVVAELDRPGAWVRRVALNRSANEGRRRRRDHAAVDRIRRLSDTSQWEPASVDDALWARVRTLSPTQRDSIVLRYVDDLPLADIALILGCGVARSRRICSGDVPHVRHPGGPEFTVDRRRSDLSSMHGNRRHPGHRW